MKVMLNTIKTSPLKQGSFLQKPCVNSIGKNEKTFELSSFNSIGRSLISFGSIGNNGDLEALTDQQLEDLKRVYRSNQADMDSKKRDAQSKLDEINDWSWGREYSKQEQDAEDEIRRRGISWLHPFKRNEIREKHYNDFKRREAHIDSLKANRGAYETIVNMSPTNKSQIDALITQIDAMLAQRKEKRELDEKIKQIEKVQQAINAISNKEGGLNDRIAGYDYEKNEIKKMFIDPLVNSKRDPSVRVPAAVLLHGATGTGKTTFLNGIGVQCSDVAKVVDLSQDVEAEDFMKEVNRQMEDARTRYFEKDENRNEKKTRTIFLINEAERFLSMTPEEAKILYGENVFDAMDMEYMERYGQSADRINEFKSLLDTCSEAPRHPDDTGRGALTIFITSNYPHLIHPDLLSRDGKMPFLAINPARNKNIEEVVKHYFKKASELTEKIKQMEDPDDIKHVSGLTQKAKDNIRKMIQTGTIGSLGVDWENIPYDKFAQEFNPSMKKGAFSNDSYRKIAEKSANMYFEDPSHNFEYYFIDNLDREDREKRLPNGAIMPSSRDINPQRYKKFVSIYNMLAPSEPNEKESLLRMERMGLLDEKAQKRLDYIRIREFSELKNLQEKEQNGNLTDEEKIRLTQLQDQSVDILDEDEDEEE